MPFLDHLEELRWRILWSLLAVAVGAVVGFGLVYYFDVLGLLVHPLRVAYADPEYKLINLSPADPFFITLKLGLVVGLLLAFPIVVYHIWSFLSPALEDHEKRAIIPALYLGLVLFCAGVSLAYFVALPLTLAFFQNFQADFLEEQLEVTKTLAFITKLLLGFGIIFELPVVVMVLSALGLVTPEFLKSKRRHAIVIITVLASILTPGDVITLTVMLMIPLFFLYEFSIYLSKVIWKRKKAREEEKKRDEEREEEERNRRAEEAADVDGSPVDAGQGPPDGEGPGEPGSGPGAGFREGE
jgi:sec-independent protein translocase protein TatC